MKTNNSAMVNYLRTQGGIMYVELYRITLISGTVLQWTDGHTSINASSGSYTVGPVVERGSTRMKMGFEVDTLGVTFKGPAITINGVGLTQAAVNGVFDGARLELRRCIINSSGTPLFPDFVDFSGRVSVVEPSSTQVRLQVKSDLELLNVQMPRNLYQPNCGRTLFDSGCGVQRATYLKNATVIGGDRSTVITSLPDQAGWFDLGTITFTSGPNAGIVATVKSFAGGIFTLTKPLPYLPSGNIQALPGCDKTRTTCENKFHNLPAFRGFPYVPKPESAR